MTITNLIITFTEHNENNPKQNNLKDNNILPLFQLVSSQYKSIPVHTMQITLRFHINYKEKAMKDDVSLSF